MNALIAALVLGATGQIDPLYGFREVSVTGWSADDARFAVRAIDPDDGKPCPGYVDDQGKPFKGRLVLAAYERGNLFQSWVVQDYPECTPPDKARQILAVAKARFVKLGIDLNKRGTSLACDKGCKVGEVALSFDATRRKLTSGSTELLSQWLPDDLSLTLKSGVRAIDVAPSGKALLVRIFTEWTAEGDSGVWNEVGFYEVRGKTLVRRADAHRPGTDPLYEGGERTAIVGWSDDETRLAARWIDLETGEPPPDPCPGYVDEKGQPFAGMLALAAYERGKPVQIWRIQDYACTKPAVAKKRLEEAKAAIAKLGIDLKKPGKVLDCAKGCALPFGGATLKTEADVSFGAASDFGAGDWLLSGVFRATLTRDGKTRTLYERPERFGFATAGGADMNGAISVVVSPSGKTVVFRGIVNQTRYPHEFSQGEALAIFDWDGKDWVVTVLPR
jgi:hypothetical protein